MINVNDFSRLSISIASSDDVFNWSHGEVKNSETINHRTYKPEKGGLLDEKIFGPTKDWECACGKYKRSRYKGIICERCGVEITRSRVRRERMGHIELATPVTHVWFLKGSPSKLAYLLNIPPKDLEKVVYFTAYLIIKKDEKRFSKDRVDLQKEFDQKLKFLDNQLQENIDKIDADLKKALTELGDNKVKSSERSKLNHTAKVTKNRLKKEVQKEKEREATAWEFICKCKAGELISEEEVYRIVEDNYSDYFRGGMGAEAVRDYIETIDFAAESKAIDEALPTAKGNQKIFLVKRQKVLKPFLSTSNKPQSMIMSILPVIPPDLRPMVQLDGGRFTTVDLNDLYRRVINRNNRLRKLIELNVPDVMLNNEKRMLQEAVDALFDNGRRGKPVTDKSGRRALKSISDMLKGKKGRFRKNLLGKRVDYSARSVIVVGPTLKLHQCGLPKQMALELFKPFVMKRLVNEQLSPNIKVAKRMVDRLDPAVWDVLEKAIEGHPVLLNRAPTLHRLGIQAFEPVLIEGKAIRLHPLVCAAFNADFDGDQMAVHVPLSQEAQAEARILMLAASNILKPADGRSILLPTQDMAIGLYYLTKIKEGAKGEGKYFANVDEARMAYDHGDIAVNAKIHIKTNNLVLINDEKEIPKDAVQKGYRIIETSVGRAEFNEMLPPDYHFVNYIIDKKSLDTVVNDITEKYTTAVIDQVLDNLKDGGFKWATVSGTTISYSDLVTPEDKSKIIEQYDIQADKIQNQYATGLITEEERHSSLIDLWNDATEVVEKHMQESFPDDNAVNTMVTSGARGNWMQIRQIAGMRGLVANPKGEIIPRPIKSNYKEGLSVLEYFIASHGARKGIADTALKTADSGYLTRRLIDVAQDIIIYIDDCQTKVGLELPLDSNFRTSVVGRILAADIKKGDKVLLKAGSMINNQVSEDLIEQGVKKITVRSMLHCQAEIGGCAKCYGASMATGELVDVGEAVGIVAAQSIGEPGTQLTMRTFHTGGVASSGDITQGLPRVQELFEARNPRGEAPIAEVSGKVKIDFDSNNYKVRITPSNKNLAVEYKKIAKRSELLVVNGDEVKAGQPLAAGPLNPAKVLSIKGVSAVQKYLVDEVQKVYRSQGVSIHDKHIETIIRQMLRYVTIVSAGDSDFLPGDLVDKAFFTKTNKALLGDKKKPATASPVLKGLTKNALATPSWLSAASFQETTKVLTDAAIDEKSDYLIGLKENVIIGKLIPAGTGIMQYKKSDVEPNAEAKERIYPTVGYDDITETSQALDDRENYVQELDSELD